MGNLMITISKSHRAHLLAALNQRQKQPQQSCQDFLDLGGYRYLVRTLIGLQSTQKVCLGPEVKWRGEILIRDEA